MLNGQDGSACPVENWRTVYVPCSSAGGSFNAKITAADKSKSFSGVLFQSALHRKTRICSPP
jgi:hypothetical protein